MWREMNVQMRDAAAEDIDVHQLSLSHITQGTADSRQDFAEGARLLAVKIGNVSEVAFRL